MFEDDAEIDAAAFAKACDFAGRTRALWKYALAPARQLRVEGMVLAEEDRVALIRPSHPPLRAIAQFVSAEAARRLLKATERFDRPVDSFLQMIWVTGVELLAISPSGVRDVSLALGGSTVSGERLDLADKIRHEIARPIYRAKMRAWRFIGKRQRVRETVE